MSSLISTESRSNNFRKSSVDSATGNTWSEWPSSNTGLEPIAQSSGLAQQLKIQSLAVPEAIADNKKQSHFIRRDGRSQNIYVLPLHRNDEVVGELVIVHDADYIDAQTAHVWRETFLRVLILVVLIAFVTLVIVRWSIAGPIAQRSAVDEESTDRKSGRPSCHYARSGFASPAGERDGDFGGEPDGSPLSRGKRGAIT